jgi:hypothetical protein
VNVDVGVSVDVEVEDEVGTGEALRVPTRVGVGEGVDVGLAVAEGVLVILAASGAMLGVAEGMAGDAASQARQPLTNSPSRISRLRVCLVLLDIFFS